MSENARKLLGDALRLPPAERAMLAEQLMSSLDASDAPIDPAWLQELDRRWAAFEAGEVEAIPVEDFFAELDRELEQQ
ncbi:hypothetical protein BH23PLA1_BH23PLA1_25800 [soil metagenome]